MNTNRTKVGLIFGGNSSEYDISIMSARNILNNFDKRLYEIIPIWFTKDGYLASPEEAYKVLKNPNYNICPKTIKTNLYNIMNLNDFDTIDVFFPIIHGYLGEDGSLQGLFKLLDKPFVGNDVLPSSITMNKEITKILAKEKNIPVAKWISITRDELVNKINFKKSYEQVSQYLGKDLFVKPVSQGSSVGVRHVVNKQEYESALQNAFKYDNRVLVEETIYGTEVEVAILGDSDPIVSGVGQIINAPGTFYNYENKYGDKSTSILKISPNLDQRIIQKIRSIALNAYHATNCNGMARVDAIYRKKDNQIFFTEINSLPGFTNNSMYTKLFEQMGFSYSDLISRLINNAQETYNNNHILLHDHM